MFVVLHGSLLGHFPWGFSPGTLCLWVYVRCLRLSLPPYFGLVYWSKVRWERILEERGNPFGVCVCLLPHNGALCGDV